MSLERRLAQLETLLSPPEPTLREVIAAALALREQRAAEAATHPTNGGITHEQSRISPVQA
jgi:hypothetical protein